MRPARVILVADLIGCADGLEPLGPRGLGTSVDVDVLADVQDEAVALVHGRDIGLHLAHTHVAFALHLEESLLHCVTVNVVEPAGHAAVHVADACNRRHSNLFGTW